jgi:hypothetical protein
MKYFIMGDSWGVGEYCLTNNSLTEMESVANTGLDYYLCKLGHTVTNISAGSAGNFGQLRHAYHTLMENSDYDFIIWFHTESLRDIIQICIDDPAEQQIEFPDFVMHTNFRSVSNYIDMQNYNYAENLYLEYNIPFIVIDGQSPMNKNIGNYTFVKHSIPWMKELLQLKIDPPLFSAFGWQKVQTILKHYNITEKDFILENLDDLDQAENVINLLKASDLFPDNSHPSRKCFEKLARRIEELK